jgi:hypothetical protein
MGVVTSLIYDPVTFNFRTFSDFTIAVQPATNPLIPGGSTGFTYVLHHNLRTKWAQITIPSNDPSKPSYTFTVKGEGYNPTITGPVVTRF